MDSCLKQTQFFTLTRWFAMPVMRDVPSAMAITATAVMKASVSGSMSTSIALSRAPFFGPAGKKRNGISL